MAEWMPRSRQEQLDMAKIWINVMNETVKDPDGKQISKWKAWGIPEKTFMDFGGVFAAAQEALTTAKNAETRTEVTTKTCERTFKALKAAMREIKRRWFFKPPLTDEDYAALGLKSPDGTITSYGPADGVVEVSVYHRALRELGVRYTLVSGNQDNPANHIRMVCYKVVAPGEAAPAHPGQLPESFITQRKQDRIPFDFGDSGKTVYLAVRTGKGKNGPWGNMISAVIP